MIRLSDAVLHFNFPSEAVNQLKAFKKDLKYLAYIVRLIPHAPGANTLKPGDIIMRLEDQIIGDNLYIFDKLVDHKVDSTVNIVVYRNGQQKIDNIPVSDVEKTKVCKFALFAGGI